MDSTKVKKTKNIDITRKYDFPDNIAVVRHRNVILVIAVDAANWIVLDNEEQLTFFTLLRTEAIQDALKKFNGKQEDALKVLVQIEARGFERKSGVRRSMHKLQLFLTNACNMRCPHCYMFAGEKYENELSFEEITSLITSFVEHGGQRIVLTGGEIKMKKELPEIIHSAYSNGLSIGLLTNGALWTEEEIAAIAPMISSVQISIDGYDEVSNARIRGKGNFKKALDNLDCFINNGVEAEVAITPFFDETLKIEEVQSSYIQFGKELLEKYSDKAFKVNYTADLLSGRDIDIDKSKNEEYAVLVSNIYKRVYWDSGDGSFINSIKRRELYDNCSYGNIAVTASGDVYLCGRISFLKPVANIRSQSLDEIFELSEFAKKLSCIDNLVPCKDCCIKYICGGDCRLKYFSHFNDNSLLQEGTRLERKCDLGRKEYIYDLMIRTNRKLFE